jgi:hypothetical protein
VSPTADDDDDDDDGEEVACVGAEEEEEEEEELKAPRAGLFLILVFAGELMVSTRASGGLSGYNSFLLFSNSSLSSPMITPRSNNSITD